MDSIEADSSSLTVSGGKECEITLTSGTIFNKKKHLTILHFNLVGPNTSLPHTTIQGITQEIDLYLSDLVFGEELSVQVYIYTFHVINFLIIIILIIFIRVIFAQ